MSENYTLLRNKLLDRQVELQGRLENIKRDAARKASADWSEQAQERENDEVLDALGNEAAYELRMIQKALERMEEGEYGACLACGEDIALERLNNMPFAKYCVRCAEVHGG